MFVQAYTYTHAGALFSNLSRSGGEDGNSIDAACVENALAVIGSALLAQRAEYVRLIPADGLGFMSSLDAGIVSLSRRLMSESVLGEQARSMQADGSVLSLQKSMLTSLLGTQVSIPAPMGSGLGGPASFIVPPQLVSEAFGDVLTTQIDLQMQTHIHAPGGEQYFMVSPLFGLTLYHASNGSEAHVSGLNSPFTITIPVDTSRLSELEKMLFSQRVSTHVWYVVCMPRMRILVHLMCAHSYPRTLCAIFCMLRTLLAATPVHTHISVCLFACMHV